jgi:hypothetical protein
MGLDKASNSEPWSPGSWADVILFDGGPLKGYWNWLKSRVVWKGGVVVIGKMASHQCPDGCISTGMLIGALGESSSQRSTARGFVYPHRLGRNNRKGERIPRSC